MTESRNIWNDVVDRADNKHNMSDVFLCKSPKRTEGDDTDEHVAYEL